MAVGEFTYGTTLGVQTKAGWVVPGRDFSDTTTPTTTEVNTLLDQLCSDIHAKLAEAGYPIDTKVDVLANAPRAVAWLEYLNEAGVAAALIQQFAIAGDPEAVGNPAEFWLSRYKDGLKMIAGSFLESMGLTRTRDLSAPLVGTWYKDGDGNVKKPLFKRGQFDYPSSRSLTEEQ